MNEPERIGQVLPRLLRQLADECEVAAMGPAAGEASPQGQGPQPAGSAAGEDTPPAGRGPIEAVGREPPGERPTGGRSDAGPLFMSVHRNQ